MSQTLNQQQSEGASFPDCNLVDFKLTSNELSITTDGLFLEGEGLIQSPVSVLLSDWAAIEVIRFAVDGTPETIEELTETGVLREICESSFTPPDVVLSGFEGQSGLWQQYTFRGARLAITIE